MLGVSAAPAFDPAQDAVAAAGGAPGARGVLLLVGAHAPSVPNGGHAVAALDVGGELVAVGILGVHVLVGDLRGGALGRGVDVDDDRFFRGDGRCERSGKTQSVQRKVCQNNSKHVLSTGGAGDRDASEAGAVMEV